VNDQLIECFRAATETLNFTVAAQKIHMSQPAFSRNIATLEEEVGFKLFWRSKQNGSRLTPAGAALYNGLFEIERQYNDLLEKAKQISRGEAGRLVIGVLGGVCLDSKSFQHVTMFRERYPQVEVELKSCTLKGLEDELLKGSCDISFIMSNILRHREEILFEKVFTVESFFMVPKSSGFTPDASYSLYDLRNETFILSEEFPEINEGMIRLCRSSGFEPKVKMAPDYETKMLWADMGMGVTGNTRDHYTRNSRNAEFIRIRELANMDFSLAWSKENYNPAIALFYSMIDEITSADNA
jgi:DNA-binding transcriptional LysR family regulator